MPLLFYYLCSNLIIMRLPAEWEKQSGVQLTWPDDLTPWYELEKVKDCYAHIAEAIQEFEPLMIVTRDIEAVKTYLKASPVNINVDAIRFYQSEINDTWARDHGGIAVYGDEGEKYLYDFVFNGWGLKFASNLDNQITKNIFFQNAFQDDVLCADMRPFVLEGGSIDTDGEGTLMVTEECLCSVNRNEQFSKEELQTELCRYFGLKRILWLENGGIIGDDTDSHIDILARFASRDTILYTRCTDLDDPSFDRLYEMEKQLKSFKTIDGKPYNLLPLPLPDAIYLEGERLPASYANFLIVNGGVLVPGTGTAKDEVAYNQISKAFPGRKVKIIDCKPLLSGHGGLHCVTMQFPEGWMR